MRALAYSLDHRYLHFDAIALTRAGRDLSRRERREEGFGFRIFSLFPSPYATVLSASTILRRAADRAGTSALNTPISAAAKSASTSTVGVI